jgi:hypothetical protein
MSTERYRNQHREILTMVDNIDGYLNEKRLATENLEVLTLLSRLFGKLAIHLSIEDNSVYPRLLECSDSSVCSMAKSFSEEMGGIAKIVEEFKGKWGDCQRIKERPTDFICETKGLFQALTLRIEREDKELYTAFDKLQ